MKYYIYIKPALIAAFFYSFTSRAQTITTDANALRGGDALVKQELEYKSPGRDGKNVVWDFSELKIVNEEYVEEYELQEDSIVIMSSPHAEYRYKNCSDSLFCLGYSTDNLVLDYLRPDCMLTFPFSYGDSLASYFYGEGKYSQMLNMVSYGYTIRKADAEGIMLLPDVTSMKNIIRIRETARLGMRMSPDSNILCNTEFDKTSTDTILHRLTTDSVTWLVDTYRWYARGYRYPVFETIETNVISKGKTMRRFGKAYYFPASRQVFNDSDDINEKIREVDTKTKLSRNEKKGNYNNSLIDTCSYNYFLSADGLNLTVEILLHNTASINVQLSSINGIVFMRTPDVNHDGGVYRTSLDLSSIQHGVYLLTIFVNGEAISKRISKP